MQKKTADKLEKSGFIQVDAQQWINLNLVEAINDTAEGFNLRMTTGRQYEIKESDRDVIEDRVGKTSA